MKKIRKSSELLWVFGVVFVALGVALCSKANLGVSMLAAPTFVIHELLSSFTGAVSVGMTEYIIQGLVLVLLCVIIRRFDWRYLLAFVVAIIYGYTLDLFLLILKDVPFDAVWFRWVMLLVGDAVGAFGVACFFRTYMPLLVYELFVAELSLHFKIGINKVKWSFDISMLLISLVLAFTVFGDTGTFDWSAIGHSSFHNIGLGTLFTTAANVPLIVLMGKLADRFFEASSAFPKLEKVLKRDWTV